MNRFNVVGILLLVIGIFLGLIGFIMMNATNPIVRLLAPEQYNSFQLMLYIGLTFSGIGIVLLFIGPSNRGSWANQPVPMLQPIYYPPQQPTHYQQPQVYYPPQPVNYPQQPAPKQILCRNCGMPWDGGAFCKHCGAKIG